ncbi:MAG: hypothetical protein H6898_04685 [Rhodobacter sp.]|nr:hypothetical protein [Paracoccaceae bacterium]MCC0075866.1 hypothetical protein [Rhodobacter sp.]
MVFALLLAALALAVAFGGLGDGGSDDDVIIGTDGDDTLEGGEGDDRINGEAGNDLIDGAGGDDTLEGGEGNDWLDGGPGINQVAGGAGDDTVQLSDGFEDHSYRDDNGAFVRDQSHLSGGDGTDLLDASGMTESVDVMLDAGNQGFVVGGEQFDHFVQIDGFERFALGSGDDLAFLIDTGADIEIDTGAGGDIVTLIADGAHTVRGGSGDDHIIAVDPGGAAGFAPGLTLDGGSGDETRGDWLDIASDRNTIVTIDDSGSGTATVRSATVEFSNFERFSTGSGDDLIDASATTTGVFVDSGTGQDTVIGGSGNDTLIGDSVIGGAGDDELVGNYADGGEGNDVVHAEDAYGGAGNDTVSGDTMTGGEGIDHFEANTDVTDGMGPTQAETITDFEPGETVELTIRYNTVDTNDPGITHPEPTYSVEEDTTTHQVRVVVNGETALIINGIDSLPPGSLHVTISGYDPWTN